MKCIPRVAMNGITSAIFNKCINESELYCEFSNGTLDKTNATLHESIQILF